MSERVFYEVADIDSDYSDYPFAVLAIYPDRPNSTGCVGIVKSLHSARSEANSAADAFTNPSMGGQA